MVTRSDQTALVSVWSLTKKASGWREFGMSFDSGDHENIGFFLYPRTEEGERLASAGGDEDLEPPVLRLLVWMGDSRRRIQAFPKGAQKSLGDALQLIQFGGMPNNIKPFKGVGSGVFEIALRHAGEAYRTVIAVQMGSRIYVLHAFHKKSKTGIETPKHEVELIRQRFAEARELSKNEE
jgi:phage-related protein